MATGLPGLEGDIFHLGSLKRLVSGEQFIKPLDPVVKAAMLENRRETHQKVDGTVQKMPPNTEAKQIRLATQLLTIALNIDGEGTTGKGFDKIMEMFWRMKDVYSSGGGGGATDGIEGCARYEISQF